MWSAVVVYMLAYCNHSETAGPCVEGNVHASDSIRLGSRVVVLASIGSFLVRTVFVFGC